VVGLPLSRAQAKLAKLKLDVATKGDAHGKVVAQSVAPHTASAPGEKIVLTVRGTGG
jgi:beta-lactam-binding protein with PASTA domain